MPNRPISMTKIRQVLRCYADQKGSKSISYLLGLSRTTVKKYIRLFETSGKSIEEILKMGDSELYSIFHEVPPPTQIEVLSPRRQELEDLYPEYCKRLKKRGMTKDILYKDYCALSKEPYSRSQFMNLFKRYQILHNPVAHIEHKAGDKMYIDYAGDKLQIIDRQTGELRDVEVFVAILPCSQLTYVEASMSQKKEDLIQSCENSLRFYGGTPAVIVPDNLKSAVTKHRKYESELNEDFAAFAEHYGITVMPARVRKPKDKALVEDAVKLTYKNIYTKLEGQKFYDLESLNKAIWVALEIHNNAPMSNGRPSRRAQYEDIEREYMRVLNPHRFELKQRQTVTVQKNGYIRVDKNFYSVPTKYIGRKLNVLYNSITVNIYSMTNNLIASHKRSYKIFEYITDTAHLPINQQKLSTYDPESLLCEAEQLNSELKVFLVNVITEKKYPEQAYKSCRGILKLAGKVGIDRMLKACKIASISGTYNYRAIEDILNNKQDELPIEDWEMIDCDYTSPNHKNVRGKDYYK